MQSRKLDLGSFDLDFLSKEVEALDNMKIDLANIMKPDEWKKTCADIDKAIQMAAESFKQVHIPEPELSEMPPGVEYPTEQLKMLNELRAKRDELIRNDFKVPVSGEQVRWKKERTWTQFGEFETADDQTRVQPLHAEGLHDWAFGSVGANLGSALSSLYASSSGTPARSAPPAASTEAPSMLSMVQPPTVNVPAAKATDPGKAAYNSWSSWLAASQANASSPDAQGQPPAAPPNTPASEWYNYIKSVIDEENKS